MTWEITTHSTNNFGLVTTFKNACFIAASPGAPVGGFSFVVTQVQARLQPGACEDDQSIARTKARICETTTIRTINRQSPSTFHNAFFIGASGSECGGDLPLGEGTPPRDG